jgi:flagellar biosynthesis protein FlhG
MAAVIAVTSGKGGVGKTNVATNLGLALAARKLRVCLFDADTGLANVNILLGIHPQFTIEHVLNGEKLLTEIMVRVAGGLTVVPASSGVRQCTDLSKQQRTKLVESLSQLEKLFDYILIDTAAGIDNSVLDFVASAQFRIVVITPEPTALTDAFALLKMLSYRGGKRNLFALVNRVDGYQSSQKIFKRFQNAVDKYLQLKVHYLGYLADDPQLTDAVTRQVPVVVGMPNAAVSCCFFALADIIKRQFLNDKKVPYFSYYWRKLSLSRQLQNQQQARQVASALAGGKVVDKTFSVATVLDQLEQQGFPQAPMLELSAALDKSYNKVYGKPLVSADIQIADLLAQVHGSEDKARELYKKLAEAYERQFHKKIDNPWVDIIQQMENEKFNQQTFVRLLDRFDQIYQRRFGVRYFDNGNDVLQQIAQLLNKHS